MPKSAKSNFTTVVAIDPDNSVIKFSSMTEGESATLTLETKKCRTRLFDDEFFQTFTKLINEYSLQHPSAQAAGVTLVLPDRAIATDTLSIPTLRRKKTDASLDVSINDLYKNSSELKINRALILQNKQFTTYSLSMVRNSLLTSFYTAFTTCKMIPQAVTFSANSAVNALQALNPKLHNATYMLMDIKSDYTRISFVSKGRTCGYYSLPFGYSILEHSTLAAEDMLFDHSQAELLVLNAKEKAKAKQLTMMSNDANNSQQMAESMLNDEEENAVNTNLDNEFDAPAEDTADGFDDEPQEDIFTTGAASKEVNATNNLIKTLPKKQPRKLPKFMQRPPVSTYEEYAYENFRIFEKWALNLIQINKKKLWNDKPEAVFVNMPSDYDFIFDMVNEEKKENGIAFSPLGVSGANEKILQNLETYGGFFADRFNSSNNF